jgi:iron complex outermembrane receptor protein
VQHIDIVQTADNDASSAKASWNHHTIGPNDNYLSQEFNVLSPTTGKFTWIGGASWFYRNTPVYLNSFDAFPPFTPAAPQDVNVAIGAVARTTGVFAQGSYQFTPAWQLVVGARENWDSNFNYGAITVTNPLPPPVGLLVLHIPQNGSYQKSVPTAKVDVNWTPVEGQFFYAFFARGYKSGGINSAVVPNFAPEYVNDSEVGWKGKFLDSHLLTDVGAFYESYQNLQQPVIGAATGMGTIVNVGSSKIKGFEASIQTRLGQFNASVGAAYVDSTLGSSNVIAGYKLPDGGGGTLGPQCPGPPGAPCFNYTPYFENLSGEENPYSPKLTLNAAIDYGFPIGETILRPRASFNHVDKQYASIFQTDSFFLMGARNLVDLSLNWEAAPWLVQLYAKNVTNELYVAGYGNTNGNEFYGAPRQMGIRIVRNF